MRKATLEDLYREKWLRERNDNETVWTTKDGKEIPIKLLDNLHLSNIIDYLENKREFDEIAAEYVARIDSSDLG